MLRAQLQGDPTADLARQIDDLGRLLDLVADVNGEPVRCGTTEGDGLEPSPRSEPTNSP